jgi:rubrerythrin
MSEKHKALVIDHSELLFRTSTRRSFLKLLGVGGTIVLMPSVFAACGSDNAVTNPPEETIADPIALSLSNDVGILNYAYVLEQLEAAFYTAVVASATFSSLTAEQQEVLYDLRNHELIHREFFKALLGSNAVATLSLNATLLAPTLTSATAILKSAETFEDLGVAAYNGAGKYLTSPDYLAIAGKIVSVEARHAAAIRDMRDAIGIVGGDAANTRFAGNSVVDKTRGLDVKLDPGAVLSRVTATKLVSNPLSLSGLPTRTGTPDAGPPLPTP